MKKFLSYLSCFMFAFGMFMLNQSAKAGFDDDAPTVCKVVFIGDTGVGKTSIINRILEKKFDSNIFPTVGCENTSLEVQCWDFSTVKLQFCDTAGQEKYRALSPMYLRDANVIVYVASPDIKESVDRLPSWKALATDCADSDAIHIVLGNKIDLLPPGESNNGYTFESFEQELKNKMGNSNDIQTFLVSAQTGCNIEDLPSEIASLFKNNFKSTGSDTTIRCKHGLIINLDEKPTSEKNCC